MTRSDDARAERAIKKRYRPRGSGERWTVDLTADQAAELTAFAERIEAEPSTVLVEGALHAVQNGWSPPERIDTGPVPVSYPEPVEWWPDTQRAVRSDLTVGVIRSCGARFQAARGLGPFTVQIPGTWDTWRDAARAVLEALDHQRRARGLPALPAYQFRFPNRHGVAYARHAPGETVGRAELESGDEVRVGTTARARRHADRAVARVSAYLERHGWRSSPARGPIAVWRRPERPTCEVVIPLDPSLADHHQRFRDAAAVVAAWEGRSAATVMEEWRQS